MDRKKEEENEVEEEPIRLNGFERPFHPLQVLSWIVFGADVISFCVFVIPLIRAAIAKLAIATSFAISVGVLVLAAVKATGKDPADPHIRLQDMQLKNEDVECLPFCTMCNTSVFPSSKHCRACNKCINSFDHHCMWLNNCIGQRNYHAFTVCIGSVAVMTSIVLSTCAYLIKEYFDDEGALEPRLKEGFLVPGMPTEAVLGILIAISVVNLPLLTLDMQLVILHTFLASQNLTTYEYIMNKCSDEDEQEEAPSHTECADPAASIETPASSSDAPAPGAAADAVAAQSAAAAQSAGTRQGWRRLKGMKTLPRCMDWIVFVRCGRSRRSPKKDKIQNIEIEANAGKARVMRHDTPEASVVSFGAEQHGHDRTVPRAITPPGSTIDPLDCIIAPTAAPGQQHCDFPRGRAGASLSQPNIIGASPREDAPAAGPSVRSGKETEANETRAGSPGIAARVNCGASACGSLSDSSKRSQSQSSGSLEVASV